ncbi:hypothetical protein [Flavobacterium koreense]
MKKLLLIITFLILIYNCSFSQSYEKEANKLKNYAFFNEKSYINCGGGHWSKKCKIRNGLVYQEENYLEEKLMSIHEKIYDDYGNMIFEISTYNINTGKKIDTLFKYKYKYDELKRVIEKEYSFGMVEKFSKFDKNSKPKLIERFEKSGETLYFWPITEIRDFDENGNLVKEIKTEIAYPDSKSDTIKRLKVETNIYKYDKFGYVIEIKRNNNPEESFPIIIGGGLSLYETENFEYKYDKTGLWEKKYRIIEGKKRMLYKRNFKK